MKLKFKALAAAAAFAVAGHASAALSTDFVTNGTLFLAVWDASNNKSYVRDLGVDLDSFQPSAFGGSKTPEGGFTQTFANLSNSGFASQFASSSASNIRWAVVGVDGIEGEGAGNGSRYLSTFASTPVIVNGSVRGGAALAIQYNGELAQNSGVDFTGAPAEYISTGTLSTDAAGWGAQLGGVGLSNTVISGYSSAAFWLGYTTNDTTSGDPFAANSLRYGNSQNFATLTLNTDGSVTYALAPAAVSEVPVPAAAWLMGSGLMGLVGAARRRKAGKAAA